MNYNFSQALNWMLVNGEAISLTIGNVERTYYQDKNGDIICVPNNNKPYKVKDFKIDAVLSNEWQLLVGYEAVSD